MLWGEAASFVSRSIKISIRTITFQSVSRNTLKCHTTQSEHIHIEVAHCLQSSRRAAFKETINSPVWSLTRCSACFDRFAANIFGEPGESAVTEPGVWSEMSEILESGSQSNYCGFDIFSFIVNCNFIDQIRTKLLLIDEFSVCVARKCSLGRCISQ